MTDAPAKRGRGRPSKLDSNGNKIVVVKVVSDRKRGRPPMKNADGSTPLPVNKAPKYAHPLVCLVDLFVSCVNCTT